MGIKKALFLFALGFISLLSYADDSKPLMEITNTKKIIHVDRLGISANTSVQEVLYLIPELLSRSADNPLENFSIQLNGRSVGMAASVILMQTKVAETDVIEISISPETSEQKDGQGGVINIKLKPVTTEGTSGAIMADFSTMGDILPSVMVNFKRNRFWLRSSLTMQHVNYDKTSESKLKTFLQDNTYMDTTLTKYNQETVKLDMGYAFTDRDELKVNLLESYSTTRTHSNMGIEKMLDVTSYFDPGGYPLFQKTTFVMFDTISDNSLNLETNVQYEHKYRNGGSLSVQAEWNYNPTMKESTTYARRNEHVNIIAPDDSLNVTFDETRQHQILTEIKTKHTLARLVNADKLDVTAGLNTNGTFRADSSGNIHHGYGRPYRSGEEIVSYNVYISPFAEAELTQGKWHFQAGARYQAFTYCYDKKEEDDKFTNSTVTGNVSIKYSFSDHQTIRFMGARNIRRDREEMYPLHDTELNYLFDHKSNDTYLLANIGAHFIHANDNIGYSNVNSLNGQFYIEHKKFAMAFAGNLYRKSQHRSEESNHFWYFNLNFTPVFNLEKDWTLSGKFTYNSPISSIGQNLGECFYTQLRASKSIGRWDFTVEFDDILDYVSYDTYSEPDGTETREYDLYQRSVWVGFSYRF